MKKKDKIFLIGMPGSGKSTLAASLANALQYKWVDMDHMIIESENRTIPHIFEFHGENHFRTIESKTLKETLPMSHTVISTGGGAPCFFDNINIMLNNGIVIYLEVPAEELLKRVKKQSGSRPLLNDKTEDLLIQLKEKLNYRNQFYTKAHFTIQNIGNITSKIVEWLDQ